VPYVTTAIVLVRFGGGVLREGRRERKGESLCPRGGRARRTPREGCVQTDKSEVPERRFGVSAPATERGGDDVLWLLVLLLLLLAIGGGIVVSKLLYFLLIVAIVVAIFNVFNRSAT
jgi:hypothetical protein